MHSGLLEARLLHSAEQCGLLKTRLYQCAKHCGSLKARLKTTANAVMLATLAPQQQ